ncbi:MAG: hypothetical protein IBJ11_10515 [Phycisphaerales bacterium]|nr:hypothetical protein [Phycisphaerales bacterium]
MSIRHALLIVPASALLCAAGTPEARAAVVLGNGSQVSLATLLAGDKQFIVGDKLFTLEAFTSSQTQTVAGLFSVIGYIQGGGGGGGLPNIGFDLVGPFGDGSPGDGIVHELNLQYTVEITAAALAQNPALRIKDTVLTFNGSATGTGSFARVDESLFTFPGGVLIPGSPISVFSIVGPPASSQFQTGLDFTALAATKIEVNKDIKTFAATAGSTATISQIRQEFSQIPSPPAIGLLGVCGVYAVRRRRSLPAPVMGRH